MKRKFKPENLFALAGIAIEVNRPIPKKKMILDGIEVEFTDISSEKYREYQFPNNEIVAIHGPKWLYVSENGHRIVDVFGISHYVPKGWIHLYWEVFEGEPYFVK